MYVFVCVCVCVCYSTGKMWPPWPKTSLTRHLWWILVTAWHPPKPCSTPGCPLERRRRHRRTFTALSPTTCCNASLHVATAQSPRSPPRATSPTAQDTPYAQIAAVCSLRRLTSCSKTQKCEQSWHPWAACTAITACTMYSWRSSRRVFHYSILHCTA